MSDEVNSFSAEYAPNARILVLGSMPGVRSLDEQQYYAHPQNLFWPIVERCFADFNLDYSQRLELLKKQRIALWDVLASCEREGSLDSSIIRVSEQVNDFAGLFAQLNSLERVCFNGQKAWQSFERYVLKRGVCPEHLDLRVLPSTSPANASVKRELKFEKWMQALKI